MARLSHWHRNGILVAALSLIAALVVAACGGESRARAADCHPCTATDGHRSSRPGGDGDQHAHGYACIDPGTAADQYSGADRYRIVHADGCADCDAYARTDSDT